jgi:predicted RNase H-like HicB family nuclease
MKPGDLITRRYVIEEKKGTAWKPFMFSIYFEDQFDLCCQRAEMLSRSSELSEIRIKEVTEKVAKYFIPHLGEVMKKRIIELEQEEDGRWIADITSMPGVMAYGNSPDEAVAAVSKLASETLFHQAARLYAEGKITHAAASRFAEMERIEFDDRLAIEGYVNVQQTPEELREELVGPGNLTGI